MKLPEPNKKELDLHRFIRSVVVLMAYKAEEKQVELLIDLPEQPFMILADEQQLEQALINVLKNAAEAIEGKGQIRLKTDPAKKTLTITDTGKGISPEAADNLFSPFFSTKRDGQGIGLTLVREILMNHGFEFSLKTVREGCTEFRIRF